MKKKFIPKLIVTLIHEYNWAYIIFFLNFCRYCIILFFLDVLHEWFLVQRVTSCTTSLEDSCKYSTLEVIKSSFLDARLFEQLLLRQWKLFSKKDFNKIFDMCFVNVNFFLKNIVNVFNFFISVKLLFYYLP